MNGSSPDNPRPRAFELRWASRVSRALLAIVVVASVQAVGTLHVPTLMGVATLAGIAAILTAFVPGGPTSFPAPAVLIAALCGYTLLQVVPLPLDWLSGLAPANADVWARAMRPFGETPSHAPLSLDPGASWVEALRGWSYLSVFCAAAWAGARKGAAWGALTLFASAVLLAVTTIAHGLLDATRVFGVYEPRLGGQGFRVAPLINANNLAGYLNLGTMAGLSLLAMSRPPIPRWAIALAAAPVLGMTLLSGSRAGILSLVMGLVLLLLLLQRTGRMTASRVDWKSLAIGGGLVAFAAILFVSLAAGKRLAHLLLQDDLSKFQALGAALQLVRDHPWFGIGRGAFESVFPAYWAGTNNSIHSHPENFLVQWASEWGLLATIVTCAAGAWLLRPSAWGIRSSVAACGLFCGFAALLLQNLADLSLEVPGVVIAACAAAGFAWGNNSARPRSSRSATRRTLVPVMLVTGLALLLFGAARFGVHTLDRDRDHVHASLGEMEPRNAAHWRTMRALLHDAMNRHPAEPYFPRLGAAAAWKGGQESPMPWIQRALERGLHVGRTHYLLGLYLASKGKRSQALLELRFALERDPQLATKVAKVAVGLTRDPDELLRCVPQGTAGTAVLIALAKRVNDDRALARRFLEDALRRDSTLLSPRLTLVRWLQEDLEDGKPACAGDRRARCLDDLQRQLDQIAALDPTSVDLPVLRARLLSLRGQPDAAAKLLKEQCIRLDARLRCIDTWIEMAGKARDRVALSQAAAALDAEPCNDGGACARLRWSVGEAALALGDTIGALAHFERAATDDRSASRWRLFARHAKKAGEYTRALRALERAAQLRPNDSSIVKEIQELRKHELQRRLLAE